MQEIKSPDVRSLEVCISVTGCSICVHLSLIG